MAALGPAAGLTNSATVLAFAPDGKTLAITSADPRIELWNVKTMKRIRWLQGNTHAVSALAFSPNGRDLVSGARDGSVRYWDPAAEAPPPSPAVLPMPAWSGAFTFAPGSKQFIALDNRDGVALLWNISPLHQIERLSFLGTNNGTVRWAPNGRTVAVGDGFGNVRIWDFATRSMITNFVNPQTHVATLKFHGGGLTLACGLVSHISGGIGGGFWDTRTWREIPLPADWPRSNLRWGAVSADNAVLGALDANGTVAWWDLASRRRLARFERYFASSHGYVSFSPVGRSFAASATDGSTTVWDVGSGRIVASIRANFGAVHGIAFSPDGRRLLSGGEDPGDVVRLLDVESGRHVATLAGRADEFWFLEMSADNNSLAAVGMAGTALLWRAPSWAEIEAAEERQAAREGLQK